MEKLIAEYKGFKIYEKTKGFKYKFLARGKKVYHNYKLAPVIANSNDISYIIHQIDEHISSGNPY
jgi:hypothetical protein